MQKVLITGANGFLGYYLSKELLSRGYFVIATGKGESRVAVTHDRFIYETLDFTLGESVEKVLRIHQPDILVHAGAISKPDECEQHRENAFLINVMGTINLLKAAARLKTFFIFISTDFVFDGKSGMYKEEDATGPVNYYGETKLLSEEEVKKYPGEWAIVRTVLVYGKPFSARQNILTTTASSLLKGERIKIFNDQVRTPTYVEDLAKGIAAIIDNSATGIYHLSGSDTLTPYEMAVAVANYLGLDASLITRVTEHEFKQPASRPLKTGFDLTKAKKVLGFRPTSFKEGLMKTFSD